MRRLVAVLLLLALATAPAIAQDDRSKRVDLARAFVELTSADSVMNPMIDAIWPTVAMQIGDIEAGLSARLKTMFGDEVKLALADVLDEFAGLYADAFTLEELQQINKFYFSDVGSKLVTTQGVLAQQMIPTMTARLEQTLPGAMQRVLEEAEAEGLTKN